MFETLAEIAAFDGALRCGLDADELHSRLIRATAEEARYVCPDRARLEGLAQDLENEVHWGQVLWQDFCGKFREGGQLELRLPG